MIGRGVARSWNDEEEVMIRPNGNKAAVQECGCVPCACPWCRARQVGLGPGPYTASEFARLAVNQPAPDPVYETPEVVRAAERLTRVLAEEEAVRARLEGAWQARAVRRRELAKQQFRISMDARPVARLPWQDKDLHVFNAAVERLAEELREVQERVLEARRAYVGTVARARARARG